MSVYLAHQRQVEPDSSGLGDAFVEVLHPDVVESRDVADVHQSVLQCGLVTQLDHRKRFRETFNTWAAFQ